jgi:hypothetical protein
MLAIRSFVASATVLAGLVAFSPQAHAGYLIFTGDAGDFVANSATAAYLTAQGAPTEFLSFNTDSLGNTVTDPTPLGSIFSNNVVFSSLVSPTFGGTASATVALGDPDSLDSEIGPITSFDGMLDIDFLADGQTASAVGFGPVDLRDAAGAIRIYDQTNTLVDTISPAAFTTFSFFGVVGTGGSQIGRIELEGGFFAIQDFQYTLGTAADTVPEPGSMLLFTSGLFGMALVRRAVFRAKRG